MILIPQPRKLQMQSGTLRLQPGKHIQVLGDVESLLPVALFVRDAIRAQCGFEWSIVTGGPDIGVGLFIEIGSHHPARDAYTLSIDSDEVFIGADSAAGAFHAAQTLLQILRQHPCEIPCLRIDDHPDFRARGVMLDISRDKVPTLDSLFKLVDLLASLKINQLQLYTEHTFAYRRHPEVWAASSPLTGQDILELDAYCQKRFIELVPNQNSFGHMERWLKLPRYADLAETPDGFTFPWGFKHVGGFSLNPQDPRSLKLVGELFDELLPHFSSPFFNVGCDETFDLGLGRTAELCAKHGKGRVYLDFLLKIHKLVEDSGRLMMFWADIALHHPELLSQIPKNVIALEWGYEKGHKFDEHLQTLQSAAIPFYVCPGTSSWCSFSGRTDNMIHNLREAAAAGVKHDAAGYLITDWGDWGHHHYAPTSWPGYAAGAAFSWCLQSNTNINLAAALDAHVFMDRNNIMGKTLLDLGNVYQFSESPLANGSRLFWTLLGGTERAHMYNTVTPAEFARALEMIDQAIQPLNGARMNRADAALIMEEITNTAAMLRHSAERGQFLIDPASHDPQRLSADLRRIIADHGQLWLQRNRSGGLIDSSQKLSKALADYQTNPTTNV